MKTLKTVNLEFKYNIDVIVGPYYLIDSISSLLDYWRKIKNQKFESAVEYLLDALVEYNLPVEKLDHTLKDSRSDYFEQYAIFQYMKETKYKLDLLSVFHIVSAKTLTFFIEKIEEDSLEQKQWLISPDGTIRHYEKNIMNFSNKPLTTDLEIYKTKKNNYFDTEKAIFISSVVDTNILIIENDLSISPILSLKISHLFRKTPVQCDVIFNFENMNAVQYLEFIKKINNKYEHIIFETEFVKKEQILKFIDLVRELKKSLNFYILSNQNISQIIKGLCSEKVFDTITSRHAIQALNYK